MLRLGAQDTGAVWGLGKRLDGEGPDLDGGLIPWELEAPVEAVEAVGGGHGWRKQATGAVPWQGISCPLPPSPSSLSGCWLPRAEKPAPPRPSTMAFCLSGLEQWSPMPGTETLSQNASLLL